VGRRVHDRWILGAQAVTYVNAFLGNVGGSPWLNTVTQYCANVPAGTTDCALVAGATRITNPAAATLWGGAWTDTTVVPATPAESDVAAAAARGAAHFGYDANAIYVVLTPSGKSAAGFGGYCASHGQIATSKGAIAYANIPYQPDAAALCGMNVVNATNTAFGTGYFDGFSLNVGHELAEAITDPAPGSGWLDAGNKEIADKCAWIRSGQGAMANVTLGGKSFAVQSLWSNAYNNKVGGCVLAG